MSGDDETLREQILKATDDALVEVFGETVTHVIHDYLAKNHHLRRERIPENLGAFTACLENVLGSGARIIEETILKNLYSSLGLDFNGMENRSFEDHVTALKRKQKRTQ